MLSSLGKYAIGLLPLLFVMAYAIPTHASEIPYIYETSFNQTVGTNLNTLPSWWSGIDSDW